MDYKRIFWGAVLVILGTALILKNLDVIYFSWHSIWHLWPVLLILWGISILPIRDLWKLLVSLVILLLTIFFLWKYPQHFQNDWHFRWNDEDDEYTTYGTNQSFEEPWDSLTLFGVVNLDAAAGNFSLADSTANLIEFTNTGDIGNYSMEVQKIGDSSVIDLDMHSIIKEKGHKDFKGGHKVSLKLNPKPVWNFNLDVGAAELNLDLRSFKVNEINLDGGASSLTLKIGKMNPETYLDLETGASSIKIFVPLDAGCEVKYNTVLSSRDLKGFNKTDDGKYLTSNFNSATQKVFISIDAAVSSIDIIRE
ncbi:MAG: DUF5668 domain-containing protein [Bacteroidales bacterium]